MSAVWKFRLFRLWLVIGVPLACWAAYEAWDAHQKIDFWQGQVEYWSDRLANQERTGKTAGLDPLPRLDEAVHYRTDSVERETRFSWIAASLAALPILGAIILNLLEWVWSGSSKSRREVGAKAPASRSWRKIASSKRAKWGIGIGGLLVLTGVIYSLRPESTTTTLIQALVQVGVLGLVLALIKFFRR